MPVNEALFWIGLATFEAGLFLFFDHPMFGTGLMVGGVIGYVYSVYTHHKPKLKKLPVWVSLLIITWGALAYDLYDRHRVFTPVRQATPRWVYLLLVGLPLAALIYTYVQKQSTKISKTPGSQPESSALEIRPAQGEVLVAFVERAHGETHYRVEIYNSGPEIARNVQVRLVGIEPLPIAEYFRARADFPYFVRPAHLADGNVDGTTDHEINAGTSQSFELLYYWESADHRIIVDGIDTKQARRDARFQIEEHECWHLRYEVSSAVNGIQRPSFLLRREGTNLLMRRLV